MPTWLRWMTGEEEAGEEEGRHVSSVLRWTGFARTRRHARTREGGWIESHWRHRVPRGDHGPRAGDKRGPLENDAREPENSHHDCESTLCLRASATRTRLDGHDSARNPALRDHILHARTRHDHCEQNSLGHSHVVVGRTHGHMHGRVRRSTGAHRVHHGHTHCAHHEMAGSLDRNPREGGSSLWVCIVGHRDNYAGPHRHGSRVVVRGRHSRAGGSRARSPTREERPKKAKGQAVYIGVQTYARGVMSVTVVVVIACLFKSNGFEMKIQRTL